MATFDKRGDLQWRVQIRKKGYPVQRKTFDSRAEAETWAATVESEMARGVFVSRQEAEATTLSEAFDRYEREVSSTKKGYAREKERIRVWKKQGMNFGVGTYHLVSNKPVQQYEYISAFSNNGEAEEYNDQEYLWLSAFAGHSYRFTKRLTKDERKKWGYAGIWEMTTVRANKEHPAMFPVELPWRCIKMHSDRGGIVLEPFSGSGTTIIAAEQTERRCCAMELSPVYCDLAVKRWEAFTGAKALRLEG